MKSKSINLLLATTNQGKIREMRDFLSDLAVNIHPLSILGQVGEFPETGETFRENARGKSLYYGRLWKGMTLAEDSGLEIEALAGAPGVHSARFSDPGATDKRNIQKVLRLMKGIPQERRHARFVSDMVLSRQGQIIREITDSVEGVISLSTDGTGGFGYDPIFYYPPLSRTFARLSPEEKNRISHRGKALIALKDFLSTLAAGNRKKR